MSRLAADPPPAPPDRTGLPSRPDGSPRTDRTGPGRWFEWRYAAAGLGWGALVGIVTGIVLALMVVLPGLVAEGAAPVDWFTWPAVGGLVGAMWGVQLGAAVGALAGLVSAVVLPHVRGDRARWWVAFAVPSVVALGVAAVLLATDPSRDLGQGLGVDLGAVISLLPALVLGWLMARTSRNIQAQRDRLSAL